MFYLDILAKFCALQYKPMKSFYSIYLKSFTQLCTLDFCELFEVLTVAFLLRPQWKWQNIDSLSSHAEGWLELSVYRCTRWTVSYKLQKLQTFLNTIQSVSEFCPLFPIVAQNLFTRITLKTNTDTILWKNICVTERAFGC